MQQITANLSAKGGLLFSLLGLAMSLTWILLAPPLEGPDETAHLMAVMEVRTLGRLPQMHYNFSTDPKGIPVPPNSDPTVTAYAQRLGVPSDVHYIRYESVQPPLYYVTAAALA